METIHYEMDRCWNWEIITDSNHPAMLQISHIRGLVFESLTAGEQHDLSKLKGLARTNFIRNKAIEILNK